MLPLADGIYRCKDHLKEVGFNATNPFDRFYESFAADDEELELHRRCEMERAKNLLGRPLPLRAGNTRYISPFLQRLNEKRDRENGVSVQELNAHFPRGESLWRREVDPVRRNRAFAEVNKLQDHNARWENALAEAAQILTQEAARHSTKLAKRFSMFDKRGRYAFVMAVMERDATPLGFYRDKSKSSPDNPIFSKQINANWDLCWAIEDSKMFYWDHTQENFDTCLVLSSHHLARKLNKAEPDEFLYFRIPVTVPSFFEAYRTYCNLPELETLIKAHLCLYELTLPTIERRILQILETNGG